MIQISNHGPIVIATNYWDSELARAGRLYCSVNAGAVRVLLPRSKWADVNEMRTSQYCVLSRGPWPAENAAEAVELMFEDHSESPYALNLTNNSFDLLPAEPEPGRDWVLSIWIQKDGLPHKAMERVCHWRRVARIPNLEAWKP
jgi:hypothetical protein